MSLRKSSTRRNRERGSVLLIAMIALVAMVTLGSLTVVTVRSALSGTTHDRFKAVALSAAEAGIAVGLDYARQRIVPGDLWSGLVEPPSPLPILLLDLPGNTVRPGPPGNGNIFNPDAQAWYEVEFLNNTDDGPYVPMVGAVPPDREPCRGKHLGFCQGNDTDGRIIIRSTGHGPNNAAVRLELEIQSPSIFGAACDSGDATNSGNSYCGRIGDTANQVAR
jgi:hypothetical protein